MISIALTTAVLLAGAPEWQSPADQDGGVQSDAQSTDTESTQPTTQLPPQPETIPAPPAASAAPSPNVFNPRLTVVGDGLYRYDSRAVLDSAGNRLDGRFVLREVELDMRVAVDPFADGVVILAIGQGQPGQFEAGIEEGFVEIKRLPIPLLDQPLLGLAFKVGRFRAETGRVNRLHMHDLPQPSRPLAIEEFFGEEGYVGDGISAHVFLPFPVDDDSAVELVGQVLTGGGTAVADGSPRTPAFVGNLRWFRTIADSHNLDLALIFHTGRTNAQGTLSAYTYSIDFLYKWRPLRMGEFHSFVFGAQALMSRRRFLDVGDDGPEVERTSKPWGGFAFAQVQLARPLYLGVRGDDTRTMRNDALRRRGLGSYLTWYPSEFLRLRTGYEHLWSDRIEEDGRHSAFAQIDFIMGAHPPEPFWVNK
jgi:hypothetical protein